MEFAWNKFGGWVLPSYPGNWNVEMKAFAFYGIGHLGCSVTGVQLHDNLCVLI